MPANEVSVTSSAYQYNVGYFKLGCYLKNGEHTIKVEPTIGMAFPGFAKNETLLRINCQNGNLQSDRLDFKSGPFPVAGGAIKYEYWISPSFGVALSAWYLTGTTKFSEQEIITKMEHYQLRKSMRYSRQSRY
jgi:hypothetical protein